MKKAVVLLSGGLDSTTSLYWAKSKGYQTFVLIFDYGQRHKKEIGSAIKIARKTKSFYLQVKFSLPWKGSALLDKSLKLPKKRKLEKMISSGIPSTYVPARNTIFLSFALSYADAIQADAIVIGANAIDYSGYPDCRPQYLNAMEKAALLGTKIGTEGKKFKILAPLVKMSKAKIIQLGLKLKVPYELTWSCYQGGRSPCKECDSCILRAKGFKEAGALDPF
ncbi:MAG: 7-cyano-7-deazaguanine synthase QueC [Elusimicrobia bacterium RIFCSPLOWO2_02_FULL_39_32]|nr:MAG: 7-cyano-7-deazaguanine synthase QueC [Elusimicrobia bacterium GWA2_38_7]OGR78986.1 MAG: 7-cyano-7-deazaguanine synthase QueC [Elusimicrobia bacterium RIFCSPHIGHO2_02_FULL_39_36]OGR92570.1 MAG: 7-cyano-7-deazaguanine synthase QueC [Elusimicrobia bacterium RIFCSPLOWO2_02_FULL_39_32]OGR99218.1 MAG: 7-cyano-7-deazaguanine synthase QueC [Elusimicrobia bacterium RIFCSPLOWO2_12_FULL_39_28]